MLMFMELKKGINALFCNHENRKVMMKTLIGVLNSNVSAKAGRYMH